MKLLLIEEDPAVRAVARAARAVGELLEADASIDPATAVASGCDVVLLGAPALLAPLRAAGLDAAVVLLVDADPGDAPGSDGHLLRSELSPETLNVALRHARRSRPLANLLEHITDGFYTLDRAWRFTYANRRAAELVNRRPIDLIGRNIWAEFPEAVGSTFQLAYERALREQVFVAIEEYFAPWDRWLEVRVHPSWDGLSVFVTDVTERKLAEQERQRLVSIIETSPDLIAVGDAQGRLTYLNRAGRRLLGLTEDEPVAGRAAAEFRDASTAQQLREQIWPTVIRDGSWQGETEYLSKTGRTVPVDQVVVAHRSASGAVEYVSNVARDLTESRRADQALRDSETRLRQLVENLDDTVLLLAHRDRNGVEFITPSVQRVFGLSVEQMLNDPHAFLSLLDSGDVARLAATAEQARAGRAGEVEVALAKPGSGPRRMQFLMYPVQDDAGPIARIAAVARDVTEARHRDLALRVSEARYRQIVETATEGICLTDLRGHITFANARMADLLGHAADALLGRPLLDFVDGASADDVRRHLERRHEGVADRYEALFRKSDGSELWAVVALAPFLDAERKVAGALKMVTDVTAHVHAERRLEQQRAELSRLSRQLLEAQEAERRHIARELHDDLGPTLTGLKLGLEAIARSTNVPALTELVERGIAALDEGVEKVRNLSLDLRPPLLDDFGIVTALRWHADHAAQRGTFSVAVQASPDLGRYPPGVENACFRVAQEALTNAARHARSSNVTISLAEDGDALALAVTDDGTGFDLAEARTRAEQDGRLGLIGMRERAELAGGELTVASQPGRGTVVRARFPTTGESGVKR